MKLNFSILLTIVLGIFYSTVFAQPNLEWAISNNTDGTNTEFVEDVFVDDLGNTYACGYFSGTVEFGAFTLSATGFKEAFVFKTDPSGNVLWAKQSSGNNVASGNSIHVDDAGAVYVGGFYTHTTINWDASSILAVASEDFYLVKFDGAGNVLHLTGAFVSSTSNCKINAITGVGNKIFYTGTVNGTLLNLPGGGGSIVGTYGGDDIIVACMDTSLSTYSWVKTHGGSTNDEGRDISLGGNKVYLSGNYGNSTLTFYKPGPDFILTNHGNQAGFIAELNQSNGNANWANSIGHSAGNTSINGLIFDNDLIYAAGNFSSEISFGVAPTTGTFSYSDTLISNGGNDIFACQYNNNGVFQYSFSEGGIGNDFANDIALSSLCSEYYITGDFENTITWSGATSLTASSKDVFVTAYNLIGNFKWAKKEICSNNAGGNALASIDSTIVFGGYYTDDLTMSTSPSSALTFSGITDAFLAKLYCTNCVPSITCPPNDTVTADAACFYTIPDYTASATVIDGCGSGYTVTQVPLPGTTISAGEQEIKLFVTDFSGKIDSCSFSLIVEADVNPTLLNCGEVLYGESTLGAGNTGDTFPCSSTITSGEDVYYQFTVPSGNYKIVITLSNLADINDAYAYTYWLGAGCPLGTGCLSSDSVDVLTGTFSNGTNSNSFIATGPGTYYFVVDAAVDYIENYNIGLNCLESTIEFDKGGCGSDTDFNAYTSTVNGGAVLLMEPCETYTVCEELFIKNELDYEWMDSVHMSLGPCFTNISNITPSTPPGANGSYDALGDWAGSFDGLTNSLTWEFSHSSGNPWGDGITANYFCNSYTFCFDTEIKNDCADASGLNISIEVIDDGISSGSITSAGFDALLVTGFSLDLSSDPGYFYSTTSFCGSDANPTPTITGTAGGIFSSTSGLVFVSTTTGEINIAGSTPGVYDVTYTVGPCNLDSIITITINAEDDPSFSYAASAFCAGDTDPDALISGTGGGTFSSTLGLSLLGSAPGTIDLDGSSSGATYTITYTTPSPACPNSSTFDVTINAEDDPSFSYAASAFCAGDTDPDALISGTGGGTFSSTLGLSLLGSAPGTIDLDGSTSGATYTITYTTPGPACPNSSTFDVTINAEDDPSFSYAASAFCAGDTDPDALISGTGGGTFSSTLGLSLLGSAPGTIDLDGSTSGATYTITYTTPGPACPNSSTFDVTINAEDDPSFSYAASAFCAGDTDPDALISGTGGGTFSSTLGLSLLGSAPGTIDLDGSTSGATYTITYTTPGPACPNSSTFDVTINAEDDPSFSYAASAFCAGDTDPDALISGTGGGTFFATGGLIISPTVPGTIDLDASAPSFTYTITYLTPGPECPNFATFEVTINPEEDPSFIYSPSIYCVDGPNPIPIITGTSGGIFTEASLSLSFIDSGTGEINASSVIPGSYTITYTTPGICSNSNTANIEFLPIINPTFVLDDTICLPNGDIDLSLGTTLNPGETQNFYSYGTTGPALLSGTDNNIFSPNSSGEGVYAITQTIDNGTCIDSSTHIVVLLPNYISEFMNPDTICEAEIQINLNTLFIPTTTAGGIWSGTNVLEDSLWNLTGLFGDYSISYLTGVGQCADTTEKSIFIQENVDSNWTAASLCLDGGLFDLNSLITGTSGGIFSGTNTITDNLFDPLIFGSGDHIITYTVGGSPCKETLDRTITVLSFTSLDAGFDQEICALFTELNGMSEPGSIQNWSSPHSEISFESNSLLSTSVEASEYGSYWIYLTSELDGVCSATDSLEVIFWEQPTANAGEDQTLGFIFETNLNAESINIGSGEWTTNSTAIIWDENDSASLVNNLGPGTNEFVWTVSNGNCPLAADTVIIIVNDIWIPQAITPNGDFQNDRLVISGIEQFEHSVEILNRWGQLVYSSTNYNNDWEGQNMNGDELPNDTYFYSIKVGDEIDLQGFIVLKR